MSLADGLSCDRCRQPATHIMAWCDSCGPIPMCDVCDEWHANDVAERGEL